MNLTFLDIGYIFKFYSPQLFLEKSKEPICGRYSQIEYNNLGEAFCACPICTSSDSDSSLVCGSDGLTYASKCWIKRAACYKQQDLYVVKNKACGKTLTRFS